MYIKSIVNLSDNILACVSVLRTRLILAESNIISINDNIMIGHLPVGKYTQQCFWLKRVSRWSWFKLVHFSI